MACPSILNDVLGPVMRGPSSSHTAGSYHLAVLARDLLGERPLVARFTFDPAGSYAPCYREQGSDLGFTAGLLGWPITDDRFAQALVLAPGVGLDIAFTCAPLPEADHPNTVRIWLRGAGGRTLELVGRSVGGGAVEITRLGDWPVRLDGASHEVLVEAASGAADAVAALLTADGAALGPAVRQTQGDRVLVVVRRRRVLGDAEVARLRTLPQVTGYWQGQSLAFVKGESVLFASSAEMMALAEAQGVSLGRLAAQYEAKLLGLTEAAVMAEMMHRGEIMAAAVRDGLAGRTAPMQLLQPTAARVYAADAAGKLALGGTLTRAAARALAAMHVNCGMGVVCAAPTAGSAGVLPGVIVTLREERGATVEQAALALLAAGAIGVIVAQRATFAAEVAGCQVEIGAAGAMAAAAVVEFAGGTARQATDAAAISFQNTMGMVCDLVQGIVEIPCHTRNAAAAAAAFVNADLILGGYENPIPLDETIDAVNAVGKMLPRELRVTSLGGLAVTPSARALPRRGRADDGRTC